MTSPDLTWSPSFLSHSRRVPSSIPSPILGMITSVIQPLLRTLRVRGEITVSVVRSFGNPLPTKGEGRERAPIPPERRANRRPTTEDRRPNTDYVTFEPAASRVGRAGRPGRPD